MSGVWMSSCSSSYLLSGFTYAATKVTVLDPLSSGDLQGMCYKGWSLEIQITRKLTS